MNGNQGITRRDLLKGAAAGTVAVAATATGFTLEPKIIGETSQGVTTPYLNLGRVAAAPAATKHIYLYATDGYLRLPDGKEVYIFGFAGNNPPTTPVANPSSLVGKAQLPAPIIDVVEGDDVYLHLREIGNSNPNSPMDGHTIHLHGLHVSSQNDGFPETSFTVMGQEVVYYFKAEHPGTFMYHCHVEASEHVQMGMYGALIVRPSTNSTSTVYGGISINRVVVDSFNKEYVMLLSDLDSRWHDAVAVSGPFNPVDFRPDYWLLNGRAFPDTLAPTNPVQPYGSAGINTGGPPPGYSTYVHVTTGQRFLLRMINMGYQTVPWHIHGWHCVVVGKDASPLLIRQPSGALHEEYTITIGSGETYDLIIEATNKYDMYGGKSPTGVEYEAIPKEGGGTHTYIPTTSKPEPTFFPQFYPMHNHDDYKVTNNGTYPGGQLTLIQADAPPGWVA